jgi:hypothetical protein
VAGGLGSSSALAASTSSLIMPPPAFIGSHTARAEVVHCPGAMLGLAQRPTPRMTTPARRQQSK